MKKLSTLLFFLILLGLQGFTQISSYEVLILGTAQDGGYPQANCQKSCCVAVSKASYVTSLALIDKKNNKVWLVDCSPDFPDQLNLISEYFEHDKFSIEGIFLTHAHIGHYLGLAQLGREVMGYTAMPVYAMPLMASFLQYNGPWSQLVSLNNIEVVGLDNNKAVAISNEVSITPIIVPHRDEYSETVGFRIKGKEKSLLFIPDIDKWDRWDDDLITHVQQSDYALIDATFYSEKELPGRSMEDIPHPSVLESMEELNDLSKEERSKVHFIHMNHTNPLLRETQERKKVLSEGYNVAAQGMVLQL